MTRFARKSFCDSCFPMLKWQPLDGLLDISQPLWCFSPGLLVHLWCLISFTTKAPQKFFIVTQCNECSLAPLWEQNSTSTWIWKYDLLNLNLTSGIKTASLEKRRRDESSKLPLFFAFSFYYHLLYGVLQIHCFSFEAGVAVCHSGLEWSPQMHRHYLRSATNLCCDWFHFLTSLHLNSH